MGVQFLPHAVGESIGGVDEDEVESRRRRPPRHAGPASGRRRRGPARRARRGRGCSTLPSAGAGVAVDQDRARRRRARAPRSPARRCRSRGRGRGRRRRVAERREDRLADAVGGRPHLPAARGDQRPALQLSGDHPHGQSGIGSAAPAPKRRRAASSSGPSSGASSEPCSRSRASTSSRAASRSGVSSGSSATREARQAVLAGAEHLALAAQAEVDLGELEAVALALDRLQAAPGQLPGVFREEQADRSSCSPRPTRPRSWCSCETP